MRPLKSSDVTATFLTDRPFLLLNVVAFNTCYLGSLLAKNVLKSKGGITLPQEIWLKIFEALHRSPPDYHLARALTAKSYGGKVTLSCKVELSALTSPLACLDNKNQVKVIEFYLAVPDGQHDLSFLEEIKTSALRPSPTSKFLSVTFAESNNSDQRPFSPQGLFFEITVPDVIAHLQDYVCGVCCGGNGHTICPGCTGGVAQRFGAFMGCGVDLACPLCLGLDFMREDKELLQDFYWDEMPEEEKKARIRRFATRLEELGY